MLNLPPSVRVFFPTQPVHLSARHGRYHEWTRRHDGRLLRSIISAAQAKLFERANANYRELHTLLQQWEHQTAAEILEHEKRRKP